MTKSNQPKVVVMGGGTGIFPVVTALRQLPVAVSTVVAVSDSGGSTGRIRDEFGFQAVGDLRQSLAALASPTSQSWIQKILLYRFKKGDGLTGHNLGNLILTALQDITGDTTQALEIAEQVFRLEGSVIPVTDQTVDLRLEYSDGTFQIGEHLLDQAPPANKHLTNVSLTPTASYNPKAAATLQAADVIIIGPGDYYASLMATLLPTDTKQVFSKCTAKTLYILNLMTRLSQTADMTATDHVSGIEAAIGKKLDHILINTGAVPPAILDYYAAQQEFPVQDDLTTDPRVLRADLIGTITISNAQSSSQQHSLLRHDSLKLLTVLSSLLIQKNNAVT